MRSPLIIVLFLICPFYLSAQKQEGGLKTPSNPILKFSPLSLIDMINSVQFALEHQIGSRQSLQHEIGYITPLHENPTLYDNQKGIRLRNEYRYYFHPDKSKFGGWYVGPEILFIYFNHIKTATFGRLCDGSFDCAYYEEIDYTINHQVLAFHPKIGYQLVANRFVLDFYTGIGLRNVKVRDLDKPANRRIWGDDHSFFNKSQGTYNLLSFSLGIKIGMLLRQRAPEKFPYYREDY